MPPFVDVTNTKINNWDILKFEGFNKNGESTWKSQCDCVDKTTDIKTISSIKRTKQCKECNRRDKLGRDKKDNIGQKHNRLTIVEYYGYREDVVSTSPYWIAKCECGSDKEVLTTLYDMKSGRTQSCGCLAIERSKEAIRKSSGTRKKYNEFIDMGDYYIGVSENGNFMFDKDDYDKVLEINKYWSINSLGYVLYYTTEGEYQLHRYLMGLGKYNIKEDIIVDHINGDVKDNRKSNLRITHRRNNAKNCAMYSNNTSGHKGVHWHKGRQQWQAIIQVDKKSIYLGVYDDLEEAIEVRKEAEVKYFGEYSRDYRHLVEGDIIE